MTDQKIERATLVDEVTGRLRALLYSGEIRPGERLRMRELQDRFGVSHIPIREALRTLEGEGLVENLPQRGAVAVPVSLQTLDEIYDARRLLEPPIAARAAPLFTDADIGDLKTALDELERSDHAAGGEFFAKHAEFHWLVLRPGANETLEKMLRQLWGVSERFVRLSRLVFPADVAAALGQHRRLYELCQARDPAVGELVAEHLHLTQDAIHRHHQEV